MATLYRKYRPQVFSEVIGQDHVVLTLQRAIVANRVGHAYLFCGPRGVGKTTVARILAKAVNCVGKGDKPCGKCQNCLAITEGSFVDLIEIDAASNRGIDEIRELRDKIKFSPSIGRKKVYIIDEVHMLTKEAFNALLKTLEEPPAHSIFVFATTEINKVPETVISRCQRFDFRLGDEKMLEDTVRGLAKKEKLKISDEIVKAISKSSGGSYRDATSLLDQLSSHLGESDLTYEAALKLLNLRSGDQTRELIGILKSQDASRAIKYLSLLKEKGADFEQVLSGLIVEMRHELMQKITNQENGAWERKTLARLIEAVGQAKNSPIDTLALELAVIDICLTSTEGAKIDGLSQDDQKIKEAEANAEVGKPADQPTADQPKAGKPVAVDGRNVNLNKSEQTSEKAVKEKAEPNQRVLNPKDFSTLSFDSAKKAAIVELVALKNKPLASLLGSSQWHYDSGKLTIHVEYGLHKDKIMSLKSRAILSEAIEEVMGAVPPLKCEVTNHEDLEEGINSVFAL